jgi:hypothetical protein
MSHEKNPGVSDKGSGIASHSTLDSNKRRKFFANGFENPDRLIKRPAHPRSVGQEPVCKSKSRR